MSAGFKFGAQLPATIVELFGVTAGNEWSGTNRPFAGPRGEPTVRAGKAGMETPPVFELTQLSEFGAALSMRRCEAKSSAALYPKMKLASNCPTIPTPDAQSVNAARFAAPF